MLQSLYERIGEEQAYLTNDDLERVTNRYYDNKLLLKEAIYVDLECQEHFLSKCRKLLKSKRSLSKLSTTYNTGRNVVEVETLVKSELKNPQGVERLLCSVQMSEDLFRELLAILPKTPDVSALLKLVKKDESLLLRSVLKMGAAIGIRYSYFPGIEVEDIIQTAHLFLFEAIRRYDPNYRSANGNSVKMSTYAQARAETLIREWLIQNSRLIRIPKTKLQRMFLVINAMDRLVTTKLNMVSDIREEANTYPPKPTPLFSNREVIFLIGLWRNTPLRLDHPVNMGFSNETNQTHAILSEYLPDRAPLIEDSVIEKDYRHNLLKIIRGALTEQEFKLIEFKYFDDTDDSPSDTVVGNKLGVSREDVRKKTIAALMKLEDNSMLLALIAER